MDPCQLVDPILLSNFIHQVINPLNGIVGTIDNIIDGTVKSKNKRIQRLTAARSQLTTSIEMIRNLAFLSQLSTDSGIESLQKTLSNVILPKIIIEAVQLYQESGNQKNIRIQLCDSETQYIVPGHEALLKQVFLNIIDNSLKYSDNDTRVDIDMRIQKSTDQLLIEISSTGVGFDYEERESIFNLGFRGEAARQMRASGSGIGLYICKRIIEILHGGELEAEHSNKLRNTIFRIRFNKFKVGERKWSEIMEDMS